MGAGIRAFVVAVASVIAASVAFTKFARAKLDEALARHALTLLGVPLRCSSGSILRLHQRDIEITRDCFHAVLQGSTCVACAGHPSDRGQSASLSQNANATVVAR